MVNFLLKVWKIDKFRQIWKNVFSTHKMKYWKFLEKSPGICGKWKNLVKSVKNGKFLLKVWKIA